MTRGFRAVLTCAVLIFMIDAEASVTPGFAGVPAPTSVASEKKVEPIPAAKSSCGQKDQSAAVVAPSIICAVWSNRARTTNGMAEAGLTDDLSVQVDGSGPVDASKYQLFLDGRPIAGLSDTIFDSEHRALKFYLRRNSSNASAWAALLGAPTALTQTVTVALGVISSCPTATSQTNPCAPPTQPTIFGANGALQTFALIVMSEGSLVSAIVITAALLVFVWGRARNSTLLRDNLLPQIAPMQQPYSLGRWQMAFWFTLVLASFLFLFFLLWEPNTVSPQALALMGISGATALGAIAVDVVRDTPVDAANLALRAIGLGTYDDVLQAQNQLAEARSQLAAPQPPANLQQLQLKVDDLERTLRTYERTIKPYVTQGWYQDLTTDFNGAALHRVQVLCWTIVLGIVFLVGVYQDLAMPEFSTTLLALMGISGVGYVGFKYPETQN